MKVLTLVGCRHSARRVRGQPQYRGPVGPRDSRPSRSPASPSGARHASTARSSCTRGIKQRDRGRGREARDGAGAARRDQDRRAASRATRSSIKVTGPARADHHGVTIGVQHLADRAPARRGAAQRQHQRDERRRLDPRRSDRRQDRAAHQRRQRDRHAARRRHPDSIRRRLDPDRQRHRQARSRNRLTAASASRRKPSVLRLQDRRRIGARHASSPTR